MRINEGGESQGSSKMFHKCNLYLCILQVHKILVNQLAQKKGKQ